MEHLSSCTYTDSEEPPSGPPSAPEHRLRSKQADSNTLLQGASRPVRTFLQPRTTSYSSALRGNRSVQLHSPNDAAMAIVRDSSVATARAARPTRVISGVRRHASRYAERRGDETKPPFGAMAVAFDSKVERVREPGVVAVVVVATHQSAMDAGAGGEGGGREDGKVSVSGARSVERPVECAGLWCYVVGAQLFIDTSLIRVSRGTRGGINIE